MNDYEITQADRERDRLIDEKEALRRALDEARASLALLRSSAAKAMDVQERLTNERDAAEAEVARLREEGAALTKERDEALHDLDGERWVHPTAADWEEIQASAAWAIGHVGWDAEGATEPRDSFRWETVARLALDVLFDVARRAPMDKPVPFVTALRSPPPATGPAVEHLCARTCVHNHEGYCPPGATLQPDAGCRSPAEDAAPRCEACLGQPYYTPCSVCHGTGRVSHKEAKP